VNRLLDGKCYLLVAVASTHFPKWRRGPLSASKMVKIPTIAETSISWQDRIGKAGNQKER
jgi:hypothetical protein